MNILECRALLMPYDDSGGCALFDPFFSELRHPQKLKKLGGVGEDEKFVLDVLCCSTITVLEQSEMKIPRNRLRLSPVGWLLESVRFAGPDRRMAASLWRLVLYCLA
jgi:hypothetical protein